MYAITPNPRTIPDVVRDARKVLKDSPCAFWAFPAALLSTVLMLLLMTEWKTQVIKNPNEKSEGSLLKGGNSNDEDGC